MFKRVMTPPTPTTLEDLIDLGSATAETKGGQGNSPDGGQTQPQAPMGIFQD